MHTKHWWIVQRISTTDGATTHPILTQWERERVEPFMEVYLVLKFKLNIFFWANQSEIRLPQIFKLFRNTTEIDIRSIARTEGSCRTEGRTLVILPGPMFFICSFAMNEFCICFIQKRKKKKVTKWPSLNNILRSIHGGRGVYEGQWQRTRLQERRCQRSWVWAHMPRLLAFAFSQVVHSCYSFLPLGFINTLNLQFLVSTWWTDDQWIWKGIKSHALACLCLRLPSFGSAFTLSKVRVISITTVVSCEWVRDENRESGKGMCPGGRNLQ